MDYWTSALTYVLDRSILCNSIVYGSAFELDEIDWSKTICGAVLSLLRILKLIVGVLHDTNQPKILEGWRQTKRTEVCNVQSSAMNLNALNQFNFKSAPTCSILNIYSGLIAKIRSMQFFQPPFTPLQHWSALSAKAPSLSLFSLRLQCPNQGRMWYLTKNITEVTRRDILQVCMGESVWRGEKRERKERKKKKHHKRYLFACKYYLWKDLALSPVHLRGGMMQEVRDAARGGSGNCLTIDVQWREVQEEARYTCER